jgi:zinc protease
LQDRRVPTPPSSDLARFNAFAAEVTPDTVMEALRAELVPLDDPLIRFQGPAAPEGAAEALRAAWEEAIAGPLEPNRPYQVASFAYTDFGPPGAILTDVVEPLHEANGSRAGAGSGRDESRWRQDARYAG